MAGTPAGGALTDLRAQTVNQIKLLLEAIWMTFATAFNPLLTEHQQRTEINLYTATIAGLVPAILQNVPVIITDYFQGSHNLLYTLLQTTLGPLGLTIGQAYDTLLQDILTGYSDNLQANKSIDPTQADTVAAAALTEASALGLGSRVVTLLFELFLPKKLNVFNWIGPQLADLAGYDKIIGLIRDPQLKAAIGNLAEYNANQQFLTKAPEEPLAREMYARRLITPAQLTKLVNWAGIQTEFQNPTLLTSYRPVQPFLLARAAEAGAISQDDVTAVLQFAGYRDADITRLEIAFAALALVPYQQQYLVAAVRATELGTMTPADLGQAMTSINLNQDQQNLVQLTVATRKLEQLAELYRKSISEAYKYGTITDAQYVPSLEGIGIGAADAQAHYAVDSIAKTGKAAAAAVKAEERLANQRMRAAGQAAIAGYKSGTIDSVALEAALLAAGYDPAVAGFIVTVQTLRREGNEVFLYGVTLPHSQALLLREQVSALGIQVKSQLVTPAAALAALAGYGVPSANAQALVADWAATVTPAADVGVLEPR